MESLCQKELKAADIDDFNDIFDGRGSTTNRLTPDAVRRHAREEIAGNYPGITRAVLDTEFEKRGIDFWTKLYTDQVMKAIHSREAMHESQIICFSNPKNDLEADRLMWSHYSNHWRGVRLGFDLLYDIHRKIDFKVQTTPFVIDYPESVKVAPTLARWCSHHGLIWSCRPGGDFTRAGFRLPERIFSAA